MGELSPPDDFLTDAGSRDPSNRVSLTIRELLALWGAKRRGYWIVDQIEQDLDSHKLTTQPPFTEGWIDNTIQLVPVKPAKKAKSAAESPTEVAEASDSSLPEVSLQVSSLRSANVGVISVTPQDSLERAQTLMMSNDFSQLPVLAGERDLRGAVSWESIAQAHIRNPDAELRDAIVPAIVVREEDDLLAQIPRVADAGYVFVQARDRRITGIITTADLSVQFATLANPFFMLAEIERRLRRIVDATFDSSELAVVIDPNDADRQVESADDLTIGEYLRLLENPERWARLGWSIDRVVFVQALDEVRSVRNEIMHFSPDPLDDDQINRLVTFRKWLRHLDPVP